MTCDDVTRALSAFLDGELPAEARDRIAHHLEGCPHCRLVHRQLAEVAMLVRAAPQPAMPDGLSERVRDRLRSPSGAGSAAPRARSSRWVAPIASATAAGLVGVVVGALFVGRPLTHDPSADVFAAHVRSLIDAEAPQVASGEQHTVRPWFAGRLPFAPAVPDLGTQGYPLVDGRLDYVGERLVAALTYRRRKHTITVFVWPRSAGGVADRSLQGYNLVSWQGADLVYVAISDLNPEELAAFRTLFKAGLQNP